MASSIGGADLVQAYVMGKLHKEKLEKITKQPEEAEKTTTKKKKKNQSFESSSGFFGFMKKRVHPKSANPAGEGTL